MASDDTNISPEVFDLIVSGTGLQEALIAGAAARAGKSVLHLDHADSYGSFWKSHTLDSLLEWASSLRLQNAQTCSDSSIPSQADVSEGRFPVYSNVSLMLAEGAKLGSSREYNIDLAPKAAYSAGLLVAALVASGGHNYTDFKALKSSFLWKNGRLVALPASRSDIFAMKGMSLQHRRSFTRFLTYVQAAINGETQQSAFDDRPFADLLKEQGISAEVRELLYALILLDFDQEPSALDPADNTADRHQHTVKPQTAASDSCYSAASSSSSRIATAKGGLEAMQMHVQSAAKFGPSAGALLLPCYGAAELPQTFCRVAAVAGALYVLRCTLDELCLDHSGPKPRITGAKTAAGQMLTCSSFAGDCESFAGYGARQAWLPATTDVSKVARAIAITDSPIVQEGSGDAAAALVVFLPHSLPSNNTATVRILQVGCDTSAAPAGRWVLYASTPVASNFQGSSSSLAALTDTRAALEQLVQLPPSQPSDKAPDPASPDQDGASTEAAGHSCEASPATQEGRPNALLVVSYLQSTFRPEQESLPCNAVCSAPPDGNLDFGSTVSEAAAAYRWLFPSEAAKTGGVLFGHKAQVAEGTSAHHDSDDDEGRQDEVTSGGSEDNSDDDTLAALQTALQTLGTSK